MKDVAAFSWGLAGMDAVMNAILRPQDLLGMIAAHVYMMTDRAPTGEVADVIEATLPLIVQERPCLERFAGRRRVLSHQGPAHAQVAGGDLVILRPLMRLVAI